MASKKTKTPLEKVTREKVASFMRASGFVVQQEVVVPTGRIDILVKEYKPNGEIVNYLIECKRYGDSNSIKNAIGQLRTYSTHYGKNTKLYICTSDPTPLNKEAQKVLACNPDILYKVFT
jgi:hypothetical protein